MESSLGLRYATAFPCHPQCIRLNDKQMTLSKYSTQGRSWLASSAPVSHTTSGSFRIRTTVISLQAYVRNREGKQRFHDTLAAKENGRL